MPRRWRVRSMCNKFEGTIGISRQGGWWAHQKRLKSNELPLKYTMTAILWAQSTLLIEAKRLKSAQSLCSNCCSRFLTTYLRYFLLQCWDACFASQVLQACVLQAEIMRLKNDSRDLENSAVSTESLWVRASASTSQNRSSSTIGAMESSDTTVGLYRKWKAIELVGQVVTLHKVANAVENWLNQARSAHSRRKNIVNRQKVVDDITVFHAKRRPWAALSVHTPVPALWNLQNQPHHRTFHNRTDIFHVPWEISSASTLPELSVLLAGAIVCHSTILVAIQPHSDTPQPFEDEPAVDYDNVDASLVWISERSSQQGRFEAVKMVIFNWNFIFYSQLKVHNRYSVKSMTRSLCIHRTLMSFVTVTDVWVTRVREPSGDAIKITSSQGPCFCTTPIYPALPPLQ